MALLHLYIIVAIGGGLAAISTVSRGSIFTVLVKSIVLTVTILILIASSIYAIMTFSFLNILGFIATYIISAWTFSFLWISIFNKGEF